MAYVADPTMPGGWRWQYEAPVAQFVPQLDADGNPTGALVPTLSRTPDGKPVARTPEEVAELHEREAAEPATMADQLRAWQVNAALKSAERASVEDAELHKAFADQARLDPRVASNELAQPRPEPTSQREAIQRIAEARKLAAALGYGLRTELRTANVAGAGGVPVSQTLLACWLTNSNGSVAYGPTTLPAVETLLATEQRQHEAAERREALRHEHEARQRSEAARKAAQTPEGRIAELERKLAAAMGQPAPAERPVKQLMPGIVVSMQVNDQDVEIPL